jgi:hypothetical protein
MGRLSPRRRLALVLVLALAPASGPVHALAAAGGDQAIAKMILPRASDYPLGWKTEAGSKPSDSGCFSAVEKAHGETARATASPNFVDATGSQRSGASVALFPSPQKAHAALRAIVSEPPLACYRKTVSRALSTSGLTVTGVTTTPLAFTRPGDTPTAARRLEVAVRKGASSATLTIDLIFVQARRALISVGFNAQSTPLARADEHTTLARAVSRARTSHM